MITYAYPASDLNQTALKAGGTKAATVQDQRLMEKCREFESILYHRMLQTMRKTIPREESLFYGGAAEAMYTDMLDTEYGKMLSGTTTGGIAEAMFNQLQNKNCETIQKTDNSM